MMVVFDGRYWSVSVEPDKTHPEYKGVVIRSKTLQRKYSKGITGPPYKGSEINEIWFGGYLKNPETVKELGRCKISGQYAIYDEDAKKFRDLNADVTFTFRDDTMMFDVDIDAREKIPVSFRTELVVYVDAYVRSGVVDDHSVVLNYPADEIFSWSPCKVQYCSRGPFSSNRIRVETGKAYAISVVPFWYIVEKYKISTPPYEKYSWFDPYTLYFYCEGDISGTIDDWYFGCTYPVIKEGCFFNYYKVTDILSSCSRRAKLRFFVVNRDISTFDNQEVCKWFELFLPPSPPPLPSKEEECPCDVIKSIFPTGDEKITEDHMAKLLDEWMAGRISKGCYSRFYDGWMTGKTAREVVPECYEAPPPPPPSPTPSILPLAIVLGIIGLAAVLTGR